MNVERSFPLSLISISFGLMLPLPSSELHDNRGKFLSIDIYTEAVTHVREPLGLPRFPTEQTFTTTSQPKEAVPTRGRSPSQASAKQVAEGNGICRISPHRRDPTAF